MYTIEDVELMGDNVFLDIGNYRWKVYNLAWIKSFDSSCTKTSTSPAIESVIIHRLLEQNCLKQNRFSKKRIS